MKVAIVYDAVYPYSKGGGERRYYELATRLALAGHDVHWYAMKYWPGAAVQRIDGVTYHGVCRRLALYTPSGRRSIPQALLFGLCALRLLGRRYDVVDCCGFPFFSTFAARVAVAFRGGSLVSTWHEVWGREYWAAYLGPPGIVGTLVERWAARVPAVIIAASPATARRLHDVARTTAAVRVLPNGVDRQRIGQVAPAARTCDVIYAGRLCDFKDVELLLAALAELVASRPGISCRVLGEGPHRGTLETLTGALRLGDNVRFEGVIEADDEFYAAIAAARLLVLPSRREGFGIVVVEANAAGVPVVVAAHPDNWAVDLVTAGTGLVAAPRPAALAAAMATLLDEPPGARADACRRAAGAYDWNDIALGYEAVLTEAAAA